MLSYPLALVGSLMALLGPCICSGMCILGTFQERSIMHTRTVQEHSFAKKNSVEYIKEQSWIYGSKCTIITSINYSTVECRSSNRCNCVRRCSITYVSTVFWWKTWLKSSNKNTPNWRPPVRRTRLWSVWSSWKSYWRTGNNSWT